MIRESVLHFLCWISLNCYFSNSININHYTVQMEIFVPILLSSRSSSLSVDKIYDWENLFYYFVNKKENLWYKHYSVWGITEGAKPFAIVKCKKKKGRKKKAWARINLYTVYIYRLTQWKCSVQTVVIWDIKTIKYKQ